MPRIVFIKLDETVGMEYYIVSGWASQPHSTQWKRITLQLWPSVISPWPSSSQWNVCDKTQEKLKWGNLHLHVLIITFWHNRFKECLLSFISLNSLGPTVAALLHSCSFTELRCRKAQSRVFFVVSTSVWSLLTRENLPLRIVSSRGMHCPLNSNLDLSH